MKYICLGLSNLALALALAFGLLIGQINLVKVVIVIVNIVDLQTDLVGGNAFMQSRFTRKVGTCGQGRHRERSSRLSQGDRRV